jgi:hypothetical protein
MQLGFARVMRRGESRVSAWVTIRAIGSLVLHCRGPRECPPALVHAHGSPRAYKEGARMSGCCFGDARASEGDARMHARRRRHAFDGRMRTRTRSCNFVGAIQDILIGAIPDILISTRSLLSVSLGFFFCFVFYKAFVRNSGSTNQFSCGR